MSTFNDGKRRGSRHRDRTSFAAVILLLTTGCGSLESVTSGQIGCAPSDITISDQGSGWNTSSWVATCHGKEYFCSSASNGPYSSQISCKRAQD
jgi:hypothetical protein